VSAMPAPALPACAASAAERVASEEEAASCRSEAGFGLIEMLVALVLLVLALTLAAQLLGEAQQMMVDAAQQALDPAAAQVATRLTVDALGATSAVAVQNPDLSCAYLELIGNPSGTVVYLLSGGSLVRASLGPLGALQGAVPFLPGTSFFSCATTPGAASTVVLVSYQYSRSRTRRSPLQALPGMWGPRREQVRESLILTTRGGGLGTSW
jgi:prepilin-type N-terminal cleavage/methylation domain-containing protein